MENHLVDFDKIAWVESAIGIRHKSFKKDGKTIKLIELSDTYCYKDWCTRGHISYILEGKFTVKFENHTEIFNTGDIVFIPSGKKHIAMVEKGNRLKMISFDI